MTVNKAEVREGGRGSSLRSSLRMKLERLQEDRGDLFFTTSVENREPLYT